MKMTRDQEMQMITYIQEEICFKEEMSSCDKTKEVKEVAQEKRPAVNPINPNFVFPEYDSRDAKAAYQHSVSSMEYAIEQDKLRKARCCCGSCKCGR